MTVKDRTVAYYYDEEVGNVNYGGGNPMRPHRVRLTHNLVENYGLNSKLRVQRPRYCTEHELEEFHADGTSDLQATEGAHIEVFASHTTL